MKKIKTVKAPTTCENQETVWYLIDDDAKKDLNYINQDRFNDILATIEAAKENVTRICDGR